MSGIDPLVLYSTKACRFVRFLTLSACKSDGGEMIDIAGCRVLEVIYESSCSLVYRAHRTEDSCPVVLKVLKEEYPSPAEITRYRQEYEIARRLNLAGAIKAYSLESYRSTLMIVFEDFGGTSLDRLTKGSALALEQFLPIAIRITESLHELHCASVIHKDVNPSNIVLNPETGALKIIDFGISCIFSRESTSFRNPEVLEGTLPYISPEQTGRMNRAIDYRSDFYSLGATFYSLLSGRPLFDARDAMEMIYSHIAVEPHPLCEIDPRIPGVLSEIVSKLLRKNAEERYQSAWGIKADLEECQRQLTHQGRIKPFPLCRADFSDRFTIPQKLYGREPEVEMLLSVFDRANAAGAGASSGARAPANGNAMLVVCGPPGIGKTSLVREVFKPKTWRNGYFVSGKFDQWERDIPYSAILKAFRELMQHLLTEGDVELALWREKLVSALGASGRLILDVIPELELIIGPHPEAVVLPLTEASSRFHSVFQKLTDVFAESEQDLVVFLDDLQWADASSLKLIQALATSSGSKRSTLYLVGAYRDNEVSAVHPLMHTLQEIQQAGIPVQHIALSNLKLPDVVRLIHETLRQPIDEIMELAELVMDKTHGNPFFVNAFLSSLHEEGLLELDTRRGIWHCHMERVRERGFADNVIDLMVSNLRKLSSDAQAVLKLASCIGGQFDILMLSAVAGRSPVEVAHLLHEAVSAGLIQPVDDMHKLIILEVSEPSDDRPVQYKFTHDRIQQAVYSQTEEDQREEVHLQAGRALLREKSAARLERRIFDIVNHLNLCISRMETELERYEAARLNLIAGRKARAATAYLEALKYIKTGIGLLASNAWATRYELTLDLYVEAATLAFLCGEFDEMEQWVSAALLRGASLLDRVRAYEVRIRGLIAQNRLKDALETGVAVLGLLGVDLPKEPGWWHVFSALVRVKCALACRRTEGLLDLQFMTDPTTLAAMRILASLLATAHIVHPALFYLFIFTMVRMSIRHGNAPMSATAFVGYGAVLCALLGDYDSGYRFGRLGMSLLDRLDARQDRARTVFAFNCLIRSWKEHYKWTLGPLKEAYQGSLETGDFEFAAHCAVVYCNRISLIMGGDLPAIEQELREYTHFIEGIKHEGPAYHIGLLHQHVLNLMGRSEDPCRLAGERFDEEQALPILRKVGHRVALFFFYVTKLFLSYLFLSYSQAVSYAALAAEHTDVVRNNIASPCFHFFAALAQLGASSQASGRGRRQMLRFVKKVRKKLKRWAAHAPMNYLHMLYLVEAEEHRVCGRHMQAMDSYDRAIKAARQNELIRDEAIANELAGMFHLARGQERIAHGYLTDACYLYMRWGAVAKARQLEEKYPVILMKASGLLATWGDERAPAGTAFHESGQPLDLLSVMKASQAMSEEIVLDKLLDKMMRIVMENAGADKGALALVSGGRLHVGAHGTSDSPHIQVSLSTPLEESEDVPAAIVNYVVRTREEIVLNDAAQEARFAGDRYILRKRPRSILCLPLVYQGDLVGTLYLENNFATGAFTKKRLELLRLLCSQAAISIRGASLYAALEQYTERIWVAETRYRGIFENAMEGMFQSTPEGRFLSVNPALAEILGYPTPEAVIAEVTDIGAQLYVDPEERKTIARVLRKKGKVVGFESRARCRNGSTRWVSISCRAIKDGKDGKLCFAGSVLDITKRKRAEEELLAYQKQLRKLSIELAATEERERRRLAEDLHDSVIQTLALSVFQLKNLRRQAGNDALGDRLSEIYTMLDRSISEIRSVTFELSPPVLYDYGLGAALEWLAEHVSERYSLPVEFRETGNSQDIAENIRVILYGATRELLINAVKHAKASHAQMTLSTYDSSIVICVADDGVGFQKTDTIKRDLSSGGFGLFSIREKLRQLEGQLKIQSEPGKGSLVILTVPVAGAPDQEGEMDYGHQNLVG